jgi:hypothetical protein
MQISFINVLILCFTATILGSVQDPDMDDELESKLIFRKIEMLKVNKKHMIRSHF